MKIDSFASFKNYLSFVGAREFRYEEAPEQTYPTSIVERVTNGLLTPIQVPADYILKNFNRPVFIIALNIIGVTAVTLGMYPDQCFQTLELACSPVFHLESWMLKYTFYILGETIITSLMLRSIARCYTGGELLAAWESKKIVPIHLGTQMIRVKDR